MLYILLVPDSADSVSLLILGMHARKLWTCFGLKWLSSAGFKSAGITESLLPDIAPEADESECDVLVYRREG